MARCEDKKAIWSNGKMWQQLEWNRNSFISQFIIPQSNQTSIHPLIVWFFFFFLIIYFLLPRMPTAAITITQTITTATITIINLTPPNTPPSSYLSVDWRRNSYGKPSKQNYYSQIIKNATNVCHWIKYKFNYILCLISFR